MHGLGYLFAWFLLAWLVPMISPQAHAQRPQAPAQQQVTLGNSTVELTGPWKFRMGDDRAWAQPDFDDSGWSAMDLTPAPGSFNPLIGNGGYLPGWTARGYKGYSGYAWYRLRINLKNDGSALAIKMPDDVDDAYQVYVNGQRVGEFGEFTAQGVNAYIAVPEMFVLPANVGNGPVTIAVRMWMSSYTSLVDQDAGGLHAPPVLGRAASVRGALDLDWDAIDRSLYTGFIELVILTLALAVALGLWWLDRGERAYLWLGILCFEFLLGTCLTITSNFSPWISATFVFLGSDAVLIPFRIGLWVIFWAYWFRLDGITRLHRMVWGLVALLGIGVAMLRAPLYGAVVPVHAVVWLSPLTLGLKLLLGLLLIWVTLRGIRTERTEGWLALPAVVLVIVSQYQEELLVLHVPTQWYPFGIEITLNQIATILSLAIVTILMLRRFLRGRREREQWKVEIEQARQVQHVLIPEALPVVPGLTLESEYRPARQVGGDFFQILGHPTDGSVLIVVGDVTGKGLQAGMLVALIVGAIRAAAEADFAPTVRPPVPEPPSLRTRAGACNGAGPAHRLGRRGNTGQCRAPGPRI